MSQLLRTCFAAVVFVGLVFINRLSFFERENEHHHTELPNTKDQSKSKEILRQVIGDVQAQIEFAFEHSNFVYEAGKPKSEWGLPPDSLQTEEGAAEWKFSTRLTWAQAASALVPTKNKSQAFQPFDLSDEAMHACITNKRVMMAGTSYQRNMYWALAKLLKRNAYLDESFRLLSPTPLDLQYGKEACLSKLAKVTGTAANGDVYCYSIVPSQNCRAPSLRPGIGVNVTQCGMPHHSTYHSTEYNSTIQFQFKTYLETPAVDIEIARQISNEPYDTVMLGAGEWGHLHRTFQRDDGLVIHPALVPDEASIDASDLDQHSVQAARYMSRILPALTQLRNGAVVLVYCNKGFNRSTTRWCETAQQAQNKYMAGEIEVPVLVFDNIGVLVAKYNNMRSTYPDLPETGHGFEGFVTEQYTRMMMAARCRVADEVERREGTNVK